MNEALLDAIKEAYALAPASKYVIHTLEVRQTGVQPTVYLAQSPRAITALDELGNSRTFEPSGFQFTLPPVTEEGFPTLNVAIDNTDRRVSDFIKTAADSDVEVELWYRPYLSDDLTQPQMDPPIVLYLKEVSISANQVTGRATFMDLVNKKFPSDLYARDRFPTLG
jgi:hypothetical protein